MKLYNETTKLEREAFAGQLSFNAALFAEKIVNMINLKLEKGFCLVENSAGYTHMFNPDSRFVVEADSISITDENCTYSIVGCTTSINGKVYSRKNEVKVTLLRYSLYKPEKLSLNI